MWEALFDAADSRAWPSRSRDTITTSRSIEARKIQSRDTCHRPGPRHRCLVNGAGGAGHYELDTSGAEGTIPDAGDDDNFIVTEIELIDSTHATVRFLSFGTSPSQTIQKEIPDLTLTYDFSYSPI